MSEGAFGSAAAPERVVARVRRHARVLVLPALLFIAAVGGIGYFGFGGLLEDDRRPYAWIVAAALVLLGTVWPVVHWSSRRSTITTHRVIVRSGFVARVRTEVELRDVADVAVRRRWLQYVFGSGDVRVGGEGRSLVLRDVPRPALVQSTILVLVAEAARARGRSTG